MNEFNILVIVFFIIVLRKHQFSRCTHRRIYTAGNAISEELFELRDANKITPHLVYVCVAMFPLKFNFFVHTNILVELPFK